MSTAFMNLTNWVAITQRFGRVESQARKTGSRCIQEICGPSFVLGGLVLFVLCIFLIPA